MNSSLQQNILRLIMVGATIMTPVVSSGIQIVRNESFPCASMTARYTKLTMDATDKMDLLKAVGGDYAPEYAAPSQEAAKRTFPNLLTVQGETVTKRRKFDIYNDNLRTKEALLRDLRTFFSKHRPSTKFSNATQVNMTETSSPIAEYSIKTDSGKPLLETKSKSKRSTDSGSYSKHTSADNILPVVQPMVLGLREHITDVKSGSETVMEYCLGHGTETMDGYLHMCTTCSATTTLADDKFPQVLNEAMCSQSGDTNCLIVNGTPHGICREKVIGLNLLQRKTGYCKLALKDGQAVLIDDWELYTQPIRVGCECLIDNRSFFARYI